ncbi:MAG: ferrous iron transport protein B [Anaeromassilibacillus sp.]|nr:ferrous iron transport protein B [Anaeromassilibacillus sp.]MDY3780128.1 ferrous iron transport protein B [Candidatus Limousia pullorum]
MANEERGSADGNLNVIKIALAGNPNCGKTTLFNQLTGSNQYVGNWPGVTVEKKEGKIKNKFGLEMSIIDLPGIYSLSPYSPEEIVTRNCLLHDNPQVIIDIVDATNIERNLYLTTQIAELGRPMVIALNMIDMLEKNGDTIDEKLLEKELGIPVVPISASKNIGIEALIEKTLELAKASKYVPVKNIYSKAVNNVLLDIEDALEEVKQSKYHRKRWTAVKLFEGDSVTWNHYDFTKEQREHIISHIEEVNSSKNIDREMIIADERYKYICAITSRAVHKNHDPCKLTVSDKIDRIATNKYLAIPLFLVTMFLVFAITFGPIGNFLRDAAEWLISDLLAGGLTTFLHNVNASEWAESLVIDGIIGGVGSVISFLPQIVLLFTLLSLLEDSGYMARAAFIMDKLLRCIGLSGRAFVPMLMGFGCTVPAVMGTRILESEKDKKLTILITPFMSCSAKMPVYLLMVSMFFKDGGPLVIFGIYILGVVIAILTALLFKSTVLKGKNSPFVMELPPYRLPSAKTLLLHIWERVRDFLVRAGTVLMGASILIWFLQSFNFSLQMVESEESILASIGMLIAPVFTLCGFGDWRASVSLVTGIAAKESVASTMAVLYGGSLTGAFSTLSAFSFLVFVLLYTPCVAALTAMRKEFGSRKWMAVSVVYQLAVAWIMSFAVFQIGSLFI